MQESVKIHDAFNNFTEASRSLETCYARLCKQVRFLTKELENKNTQLRELRQHHKRNLRLIAMGEMAATIVHEIRSPLCSIELYSNMLMDDLKDTDHAEMAGGISTGIRSLNNILTNMILFAKPRKLSFSELQIRTVIEDALKIIAPLIEIRGIEISHTLTDHSVTGDNELLKQVFMNILLNAVQSMPEGGNLKIQMESGGEYLRVIVVDEGVGIDPDNLESIFDPFFTTKEQGTGLGLAIAHKIVQSHEGFIKASRNEDRGSTFCLYFPRKDNPDPDSRSNVRKEIGN
jgi:signal transduction histidine kinase